MWLNQPQFGVFILLGLVSLVWQTAIAMAQNQAAYLPSKQAPQLEVRDAPHWTVGAHEVLIKNVSVAVNPADWKIQEYGIFVEQYPAIIGEDVAGTFAVGNYFIGNIILPGIVETVGEGVQGLKKGDRVLTYAVSLGLGGKVSHHRIIYCTY